MSVLNFRIELTVPAAQGMERDILLEFAKHIDNTLNLAFQSIRVEVDHLFSNALRTSPVWDSLQGGELQNILLVESASGALLNIERNILDDIRATKLPTTILGSNINGGLKIEALNDNYASVLSSANTSYITVNGMTVPWLEWLLYYGDGPVMIRGRLLRKERGVFAVRSQHDLVIPSEYAGVPTDNFITRAIKPLESQLAALIEQEVSRRA